MIIWLPKQREESKTWQNNFDVSLKSEQHDRDKAAFDYQGSFRNPKRLSIHCYTFSLIKK